MDGWQIARIVFVILVAWAMIYSVIWSKKHSEEAKASRERMEKVLEEQKHPTCDGEVYCPKCNSTQIQMVPRKWSPLTGFLTNKVDRVCVNCKTRF